MAGFKSTAFAQSDAYKEAFTKAKAESTLRRETEETSFALTEEEERDARAVAKACKVKVDFVLWFLTILKTNTENGYCPSTDGTSVCGIVWPSKRSGNGKPSVYKTARDCGLETYEDAMGRIVQAHGSQELKKEYEDETLDIKSVACKALWKQYNGRSGLDAVVDGLVEKGRMGSGRFRFGPGYWWSAPQFKTAKKAKKATKSAAASADVTDDMF